MILLHSDVLFYWARIQIKIEFLQESLRSHNHNLWLLVLLLPRSQVSLSTVLRPTSFLGTSPLLKWRAENGPGFRRSRGTPKTRPLQEKNYHDHELNQPNNCQTILSIQRYLFVDEVSGRTIFFRSTKGLRSTLAAHPAWVYPVSVAWSD